MEPRSAGEKSLASPSAVIAHGGDGGQPSKTAKKVVGLKATELSNKDVKTPPRAVAGHVAERVPHNCPVLPGDWTIAPLWDTEEEERLQATAVDFTKSVYSLIYGRHAQEEWLLSLRRRPFVVGLSALAYNASFGALIAVFFVRETQGVILSIFAFLGSLPVLSTLALSLNPILVKKLVQKPQFWEFAVTVVAFWGTVGVMLGGLRGAFLLAVTLTAGIVAGPFTDAFHFHFRSKADAFWGFIVAIILVSTVAISVVFKGFRGGVMLRWSIGSRQLTGEDVVVQTAGTDIIFMTTYLLSTSIAQRMLERRVARRGSGPQLRKTIIQCPTLQWPLVLKPWRTIDSSPDTTHKENTENHGLVSAVSGTVTVTSATTYAEVRAKKSTTPRNFMVPLTITVPRTAPLDCKQTVFSHLLKSRARRLLLCRPQPEVVVPHGVRAYTMEGSRAAHQIGAVVDRMQRRDNRVVTAVLRPLILCGGVACYIPLCFYLCSARKEASSQYLSSSSLAWLSPLAAIVCFAWSIASSCYLSTAWNVQLVRLTIRTSFDFWFLALQAVALLLSLSDAFEYDERCLVLVSWCILYLGCLFNDAILPCLSSSSNIELKPPVVISKRLVGLAVLLPLLLTQCWFLYDLIYKDGSFRLRFRTLVEIAKDFDKGGERGGDEVDKANLSPSDSARAELLLRFSTDSFIIARLTSLIIFSLPLLYHLVVICSVSDSSSSSVASSSSTTTATHQGKRLKPEGGGERRLYFLRGAVSYEHPCPPPS